MTLDHPPLGVETTTPLVPTPPNTKEETKEDSHRGYGRFNEFWKLYPRKQKKDYARKIYLKTIKEYNESQLMDKKDERYIPHCSTWLNQKQYLDYNEVKERKRKSLNAIAG